MNSSPSASNRLPLPQIPGVNPLKIQKLEERLRNEKIVGLQSPTEESKHDYNDILDQGRNAIDTSLQPSVPDTVIESPGSSSSPSVINIDDSKEDMETSSEASDPEREKENRKRPLEVDERTSSRASTVDEQQFDTGSRGATAGGAKAANTIDRFFIRPSTAAASATTAPSSNPASVHGALSPPAAPSSRSNAAQKARDATSNKDHSAQINEFKRELESLRMARDIAESKVARLEDEVGKAAELKDRNLSLSKCLEEVYRANARADMRRKRDRLALDSVRLGKFRTVQTGHTSVMETFEDGFALKELSVRSMELLQQKEELDRRRKRLASQRRIAKKEEGDIDLDHDLATEAEALKAHAEQQKRDEVSLADERRLLEGEKEGHKKELRRVDCEDRSRFTKDLPCLNGRYILTSILGRGGFSEVWRAFDLVERRDVAIKVHQLNPGWTEERKESYIRHVRREYTIHKDMQHPRIVQLFDVFEIDINSFATVMELCRGTDLDERLKKMRTVPEKDCKVVVMQVLSGLRYLNTPSEGDGAEPRRKAIIHYDLKPANILFDEFGDVKITDFGLSKIIDDDVVGTSIELTSQGSGTYWYLPPECSEPHAVISPKVDIWSLGVIFYQMLFGKRPFGEGKSQEQVLREGIMRNARQVDFPAANDPKAPKVSEEVKDFIRLCLSPDQHLRPDIQTLCAHPYLRVKKPTVSRSSSGLLSTGLSGPFRGTDGGDDEDYQA